MENKKDRVCRSQKSKHSLELSPLKAEGRRSELLEKYLQTAAEIIAEKSVVNSLVSALA